jgi:hypothetical protein
MTEWTDVALPILRAVHQWERAVSPGQVIDDARIAQSAGLSDHNPVFRRTLAALVEDGFLNGQDVGSQTSWGFHIRGLTPEGRRELGGWPQLTPLTDVEAKRRIRGALMYKLYDSVDGDITSAVELDDLSDELGITRAEGQDAGRYLENEGLIQFHAVHGNSGLIGLTHDGLKEAETGRLQPSQPTEHLPAAQVITITGPVTNSQIGQAGGELRQAAVYNGPTGPELENLLRTVREAVAPLEMDETERQVVEQNIQVLEATANRDDPAGKRIAAQAMASLRSILEGMVATGAYAGLLHLLPLLPH